MLTFSWFSGWPCAFAEGLKLSGWDISSPMDVRQALGAVSGNSSLAGYSSFDSNWNSQEKLQATLNPALSPWIVVTKKESEGKTAAGIKANYAYSASFATDEDKARYKSNET